jgi:hypothetical protein
MAVLIRITPSDCCSQAGNLGFSAGIGNMAGQYRWKEPARSGRYRRPIRHSSKTRRRLVEA